MGIERFMCKGFWRATLVLAAAIAVCGTASAPANAQVDTGKPVVVKTKAPKRNGNTPRFAGTVLHANIAQITVRGKDNEMVVRTFPLSAAVSARMQRIVDRGGYQYGDKVTVIYDPITNTAIKIKGKPSKPI
ncbi:MAG TPA: hypothetical protein VEU31_03785 [Candidatus Acidoferrales bacterium]|nr:hypothetical protein [Candidatus Acidoferrales bacterium]